MSIGEAQQLVVHTDGAARGNPGPAGIGIVIADQLGKHVARLARYLGSTTNNVAEYTALLAALEEVAPRHPRHVDLFLDSELVVRQLEGRYRVRDAKLRPLYERCSALLSSLTSVTIRHVPREANREADELANQAIDKADRQAIADRQVDRS